jgi:hypothetical protein
LDRNGCSASQFARRLFAGRAHIHADFHSDRHFDDFRGFPGHFGSPFDTGRNRRRGKRSTGEVQGSRKGVQPASKPDRSAKLLQKGVISDALRDRHRGCRAAESPGCCPLRGSARAFPGRRPRAGIARRRSAPACHRGARATDRWSFPPAPHGSDPAAAASANNRRHAPAVAVRSGPAALWAPAGPARSPSLAPQSAGMKVRLTGSSAWEEKRPDRAGVPLKSAARFTICRNGSAKNAHRRHLAALSQGDATMLGRPIGQPRPRELRPPAEPPRQWRESQMRRRRKSAMWCGHLSHP